MILASCLPGSTDSCYCPQAAIGSGTHIPHVPDAIKPSSLTTGPTLCSAGAIVLTGGDEEAEKAALELCKEAEISVVLCDSQEQAPAENLSSTPTSFMRWAKQ